MSSECMRLSLVRKEVEVILEDENKQERKMVLRELTGADRNKYLNQMTSRVKIGKDGKAVGIKSFDGFQADLLGRCLYDENNELVTVEAIEELPSSTQALLFEKAQELSGLDKTNEDGEAKNG